MSNATVGELIDRLLSGFLEKFATEEKLDSMIKQIANMDAEEAKKIINGAIDKALEAKR